MARKKKIKGILQRGSNWVVNKKYKGHRIWETCATQDMAETVMRKRMIEIDEGKFLDKKRESKLTLEEFSVKYLEFCEGMGQKAVASKKSHVENILSYFGKDTKLSKITKADVEGYHSILGSTPGRSKERIKQATINRRMATLKHMLNKSVEWGHLENSPASGLKLAKENNRRLRYLTPEECQSLVDACPSQDLRDIVILAIHTGMRKGEVFGLQWPSVNLRQGYIEITDQKNAERSTIRLDRPALDMLRARRFGSDSEYVFPGDVPDKPYCDLKRQFAKAVAKAGLVGVSFHTLRHTTASLLVMAGVDLATVKEIMRHKSIEMTLRYAHLSPSHQRSAMDSLEKALTPTTSKKQEQAEKIA